MKQSAGHWRVFPLSVLIMATAWLSRLAPGAPALTLAAIPFHEELLEDRAQLDLDIPHSQIPGDLWMERARIQRELREWDGALLDLSRAMFSGAASHDVYRERADVFLSMGEPMRAEAAATRALEDDPQDHDARVLRARARMESGLYVLAADDFGRALEMQPRRPLDLACAGAAALAAAGEGAVPANGAGDSLSGPRLAIAALDREIAVRGPLPSLMLMALGYERELGDHSAALTRIEVLRGTGWSAVHHGLHRGDVLADMEQPEEALVAWRQGLDAQDQMPQRRRTTRAALRTRAELVERIRGAQQ